MVREVTFEGHVWGHGHQPQSDVGSTGQALTQNRHPHHASSLLPGDGAEGGRLTREKYSALFAVTNQVLGSPPTHQQ